MQDQLACNDTASPGDASPFTKRVALVTAFYAVIDDQVWRYQSEKKQIFKAARTWEAKRDLVQQRDPYFDWAQIRLQIAIILASTAIIINSVAMFSRSAAGAACGVFLLRNGFFFWLQLPWQH